MTVVVSRTPNTAALETGEKPAVFLKVETGSILESGKQRYQGIEWMHIIDNTPTVYNTNTIKSTYQTYLLILIEIM